MPYSSENFLGVMVCGPGIFLIRLILFNHIGLGRIDCADPIYSYLFQISLNILIAIEFNKISSYNSNRRFMMPPKNHDLEYEIYLEERKSLIKAKNNSAELFDRAILTLAAGAFGLSLTFINKTAPNFKLDTIHLIRCAWFLLSLSIIFTLTSFLTSQSAHSKAIKNAGNAYENKPEKTNYYRKITWILNIFSIITFSIGIFLLAQFSTSNINVKEIKCQHNKAQVAMEKMSKKILPQDQQRKAVSSILKNQVKTSGQHQNPSQ